MKYAFGLLLNIIGIVLIIVAFLNIVALFQTGFSPRPEISSIPISFYIYGAIKTLIILVISRLLFKFANRINSDSSEADNISNEDILDIDL